MIYRKYFLHLCVYVFCVGLLSCVQPKAEFKSIPAGIWRGVLLLDRTPVVKYGDDRDIEKNFDFDAELPFTFEIGMSSDDSMFVTFFNGSEKIIIHDVSYGKSSLSSRDTLRIDFVTYDTYISAIYEDGILEGNWVVNYKENYMIPFKATFGQNHRFVHKSNESSYQLTGKWKTTFEPGTEDEYPAVGEFLQEGNEIQGTFLTETGDYRFLHGNIIQNKVYLSAFDGAHAFLFNGKFTHPDSLIGTFRSGKHYQAEWMAGKDSTFSLADPYSLTTVKKEEPMEFVFPNTEDILISLNDPKYRGKIKIVQIMGTWCPNCWDETEMLKEYFAQKNPSEVAWISLAFERYDEKEKVLPLLKKYKKKMGLDHEVLWAGNYKKSEAEKSLPQISKIMSFPTLLILDKNNFVRKIHTGFSGPATKEYNTFRKEFVDIIDSLKNEN